MPGIVCDYMQIAERPPWGPDHRGLAASWAVCAGEGTAVLHALARQHPAPRAAFSQVQEIRVLKKCLIC